MMNVSLGRLLASSDGKDIIARTVSAFLVSLPQKSALRRFQAQNTSQLDLISVQRGETADASQ